MGNKRAWDDIRFALAVADAGSVNAAAKLLEVNHATVLRRIAQFEERVGVTFFRKSTRGYAVDPAARQVLEAMRAVEAAVDRFGRVVAGKAERVSGPVQLTSTDSLSQTVLPRHVAALRAAHPDLTVTMISTNARLNFSQMDAEVTIRPAQALSDDMVGDSVGVMRMRVYGAPSYLEAHSESRAEAHRWLGVSDLLSRSPVYDWQARLPQERIALRADSFLTLAAHARAGLGLAMLPSIAAEGLVRAPVFDDELTTNIWVAAHPDLADAPRIALCRNWFIDALSADPRFKR